MSCSSQACCGTCTMEVENGDGTGCFVVKIWSDDAKLTDV